MTCIFHDCHFSAGPEMNLWLAKVAGYTFEDSCFQFDFCLQIGNAVPPLLAEAIGRAILPTLRPKRDLWYGKG